MLLSNVRSNNQGFTLIETTIIVVIVGILSAIAAPSFLSMLNRNKVNNALTQVRGALQEVQRKAIRKSISCKLTIDTTNKKITTAPTATTLPPDSCIVTGAHELPSGVAIETNLSGTPPEIQFSYKGTITLPDAGTVVLSNADTSRKLCLVISSPLGIIRTGEYSGSTSPIRAGNCTIP